MKERKVCSVICWIILRCAIIAMAAGLSNCASLIAKKNTYASGGPAVKINGAEVRMQVNPQGTENGTIAFSAMVVSAAVATMEGPFRWRIEATGRTGVHQSLVVHRIHTSTEKSKRSEWYPVANLNKRENFRDSKEQPGVSRARYEIPGLLKVTSANDGKLTILADISIDAKNGSQRRMVKFTLDPASKRADEFIFLPVELVRTIGKDWEDIEDPSWDQ